MRKLIIPGLMLALGVACGKQDAVSVGVSVGSGTTSPDSPDTDDSVAPSSACPLQESPWTLHLTLNDDGCGFASQLSGDSITLRGTPTCTDDQTGDFTWAVQGDLNTNITLECSSDAETFVCGYSSGAQTLSLSGGSNSGTSGGGEWQWLVSSCVSSGPFSMSAD